MWSTKTADFAAKASVVAVKRTDGSSAQSQICYQRLRNQLDRDFVIRAVLLRLRVTVRRKVARALGADTAEAFDGAMPLTLRQSLALKRAILCSESGCRRVHKISAECREEPACVSLRRCFWD